MNRRKPHEIASSVFVFFGALLLVFYSFSYGFGLLKDSTKENLSAVSAKVPQKDIPTEEEKADNGIKLIFVGDIMLSRGIDMVMEKTNDWSHLFLAVEDYLKSADLTFGNLEGPISSNGKNMGSIYSFRADPESVEGLSDAGFDVLSVANNHIWDYGPEALQDTLAILRGNNMSPVGAGSDFNEAHEPVVREINGTKIAFLGYTDLLPLGVSKRESKPNVAYPDPEIMKSDIEEAKKIADIVIVSFHFGDEYQTKHNMHQEKLAHSAIDAGANMIVGHHPHVIQDTEDYKGAFIAYSLGNFIFDQNFSKETSSGLLLDVTIKDKKITNVKKKIVQFNSLFQPFIAEE